MKNLFTRHPNSVNETYFEHFKFAFLFGMNMLIGGLACIVHAFFPFIFEKTGSHFLLKTMHDFIDRMPIIEDERVIDLSQAIEKKLIDKKTGT